MISFRNNHYRCASEITLELISGKWKILILSYLSENTFRFHELQKLMPGTTQKMLTAQLRDLENDGLIVRKVYPVAPPKVEYYLSEYGCRLVPMLKMLCEYGADYVENFNSDPLRTEDQHA
ncbi:winged helix-turn-helix transcriptional regulator [Paenibacillus mucilaginosus]|uniref:HxlR family transcriptional regulator n=3 Tax=Paenibacillus mucilaginosus TaxID=61624 RepID=H6NJV8_9BACL|nr:helix-turn-helix domain-containing protein [Paenibacillus mucilaginosus]AEI41757.1 transcriptional regulator, HxlR family [Paenibacillus mucilaginosus KNP414]AFC30262.1 HxlR family transcriptional regulator [Paenibacillus mucilaginosus 3016]AFH62537.1 HxlR family transcriptional regulator [Paenibacillus mucilaginosus K02]MCG7214446.1 helix-turn-helix transcriptional regulator [Paenibacillus mucilaginosus]WDM30730.1 helix-turn-helix transcriptional regulator [Paenibacillus mucilaginosus]